MPFDPYLTSSNLLLAFFASLNSHLNQVLTNRRRSKKRMATRSKKSNAASGRRSTPNRNGATGNSRMDAIAMLKQDHTKVRGLLSRLAASSERAKDRRTLLL